MNNTAHILITCYLTFNINKVEDQVKNKHFLQAWLRTK